MEIALGILIGYSIFIFVHWLIIKFCLTTLHEPNLWSFLYLLFSIFTIGNTITSIVSINYEEVVNLDNLTVTDNSTHLTYRWYNMNEFTNWILYLQSRGEEETIEKFNDINVYMTAVKRDIEKEIIGVDKKGKKMKLYFALKDSEMAV